MDWKILISDSLEEEGKAILNVTAQVDDRSGIGAQELLQLIGEYEALIVHGRTKVNARLLEAARSLKVVGRAGVGVDNIDLEAARAHRVTVVNAPSATTQSVAELTLGLILALARDIPRADASMKQDRWLKKELMGVEIAQKSLGIIGMGRIGSAVAQRASALGMNILGYDPSLEEEQIHRQGAQPLALKELYQKADFITIHVPLTDQTRHLLDAGAFDQMKAGVRLVCAARGGIIDEEALLAALESGKVAGAALDVFQQEPPGKSALIDHPHLIATPHIGAQTHEAQTRVAMDIAEEVLAALRGEPLHWKIV